MKNKLNYFNIVLSSAVVGVMSINPVHAIGFNESQARSDVKKFLDPLSNWLLGLTTIAVGISITVSYLSWNAKDDEEKLAQPFKKTAKNHLLAYIIAMAFGIVIKWFSF